jgi:hypothetical protein
VQRASLADILPRLASRAPSWSSSPHARRAYSHPDFVPFLQCSSTAAGFPRRTRRRPPTGCAQPIRDTVETRGEKPLAVLDVYFLMCVMFDELPPTNLCVFAASGRRRASRFARSTKHRAVWTTHVTNLDSSRLFTWYFVD